eukprot:scaffold754_cov248-Pinguiococcus_pyrenoidosus.AAC.43
MAIVYPTQEGLHGTGSRFLPLQQMQGSDYLPRIVRICGTYPGLSVDELTAAEGVPPVENGNWVYDFMGEEASAMGVVAIPGCRAVNEAKDPVALIASAKSLGVQLLEEAECVVVVDRQDVEFDSRKFYAFSAPDSGLISICWRPQPPAGWPIVGRVVYVMVPFLQYMAASKTGFVEIDDDM